MLEEVFEMVRDKMKGAIKAFEREIATIRTGRASATLLDPIRVDYYGSPTPINQMATISVPEPTLIVIQPWDPTVLSDIERAIQKSDLGLTPMNDGKIIRLPVPPLTEERRNELVRKLRKVAEESRVSVRNARREGNEMIKDLEKESEVSEDEAHRALEQVQKITDEHVERVDEILSAKEKDILEF